MSNTRNITPITAWTQTGQQTVTMFSLTDFFNYGFMLNCEGTITYRLFNTEGESAVELIVGNLQIPSQIVQQWGADDGIIFDYVAEQLGFTIINL
jgi:hypothetical protein